MKGFSLIELTIVMLLSSLLLAVVGPFGAKQLESFERKEEINHLSEVIQYAKSKAFLTSTPYSIILSGADISIKSNKGVMLVRTYKHISFNDANIKVSSAGYIVQQELIIKTSSQHIVQKLQN